MAFSAVAEGPVVIDPSLELSMKTTGYVSSINGKQGAVSIDVGGLVDKVGGIAPDEFKNVDIFGTAGGTAVIRTPEQHGAPADNVGDDTAAVQAAVNYCNSRGGGTVLLTGPYYRMGGVKLRSGVQIAVLAPQKGTGLGFSCSVRPPASYTGYMIDAALEYEIVLTGTFAGSCTVTAGYGSTSTSSAITSFTAAAWQTALRARPGLGSVTVVQSSSTKLTVQLDASVGSTPSGGAIAPGTWTIDNTSMTGGATVSITRRSVDGAGVHGLSFFGGVTSGADPTLGGIRARLSNKLHCSGISGASLNAPLIIVGGGEATIQHVNGQLLAFSAPASPTGVITTYGADHRIDDCELSGSTYPPGAALVDSTNRYHCALAVNSTTTTCTRILAEFADTDIFAGGSDGTYIGCRADMSGGHGIYEPNYVAGNTFIATTLLSPGLATNNTYDGMHLDGIGHRVDGVVIDYAPQAAGTTNRCRFVVYDNDTSASSYQVSRDYESTFAGIRGNVAAYQSELFFSASGRACRTSSGGDPAGRPPAKYAIGQTWRDTLNGRSTESDGTYWRARSSNQIVGNVLPGSSVTFTSSIGWQAVSSRASSVTRADGHADFTCPWEGQAVANATAVSAGSVWIANTGSGTATPVVAGHTYWPAVRALSPRAGGTVAFQLTWYDVGGSIISSTSVSATVAIGLTNTLAVAAAAFTAPALAVKCILSLYFACTSMANADVFKFAVPTLLPDVTAINDVEPV